MGSSPFRSAPSRLRRSRRRTDTFSSGRRARGSPRARSWRPPACDAPMNNPGPIAPQPGLRQDQFLTVLPRDEALRRWHAALDPKALPAETVPVAEAPGRVVARTLASPADVPPFDRSGVDGFALRAADGAGASDVAPVVLTPNPETIACGVSPALAVAPGTATPIATGGPIPRGADAGGMVEHTDA